MFYKLAFKQLVTLDKVHAQTELSELSHEWDA